MILFPNAKINLGLNIVSKRDDGYHNIESVFYPLPLTDILEVTPSKNAGITFKSDGIAIPGDSKNNLCVKAYQLLSEKHKLPGVDIFLYKNIPTGAGLGGGSADGSYTILALNEMFSLGLQPEEMEGLALQLGSDCPFFINNQSAFVSGRGECIESYNLNLKGIHYTLIHPGIHISTAEAYSGVRPSQSASSLKDLLRLPVKEWKDQVYNDFEASVFPLHPEIADLKNKLYEQGALYAQMSGSGSAVYCLSEEKMTLNNPPENYKIWQGVL